MTEENAIVVQEAVSLGAIQASGPQDVIARASGIAKELAKIIKSQKLYSTISGKNFVKVEGWSTMGAMLGIVPREVSVIEHESGDFEATVELVRAGDGAVIGRASAIVGADENTWNKRPRYARRSMAVTRATGKAFRLGFSWIVTLAGFEPTPAEEMDGVIDGHVVSVQAVPEPEPSPMDYKQACEVTTSEGTKYGDLDNEKLSMMTLGIRKGLAKQDITEEHRTELLFKRDAIKTILAHRATQG